MVQHLTNNFTHRDLFKIFYMVDYANYFFISICNPQLSGNCLSLIDIQTIQEISQLKVRMPSRIIAHCRPHDSGLWVSSSKKKMVFTDLRYGPRPELTWMHAVYLLAVCRVAWKKSFIFTLSLAKLPCNASNIVSSPSNMATLRFTSEDATVTIADHIDTQHRGAGFTVLPGKCSK